MSKSIIFSVLVMFILMSAGWVNQVQSQEKYPSRAIEIIVPFAPGGSLDVVARLAGAYLKKKWGVPVNAVNKPGGNTIPANVEVYNASPDGYTIFTDQEASTALLGIAVKDIPFKVTDRTFIGNLVSTPNAFFVPGASPYKSLKDAMADAKNDPEKFTWASLGGISGQDLILRQLFKVGGVDITRTKPVMSQGGVQGAALAAGGHVKFGGGTTVASAAASWKAGTIRLLAIVRERHPGFPQDVPTIAEAGYPSITQEPLVGFTGPPKMPSYIVDLWNVALQEMLKDPEFNSRVINMGLRPFYLNPQKMKESLKELIEEVADLYPSPK